MNDWCVDFGAQAGKIPSCPTATLEISKPGVSGTIAFNADLSFQTNVQLTFVERVHFPSSCFDSEQCTAYETTLADQSEYVATCSYDATTGCSCSINVSQAGTASGTYQTAGNSVTMTTTGSDKPPEVDPYCVSGNTLHLQNMGGILSVISGTK